MEPEGEDGDARSDLCTAVEGGMTMGLRRVKAATITIAAATAA
jgi:hypothetical protein